MFLSKNTILCGSAVGINPFDSSYDLMAKILNTHKYKFDFDHKNWDFNLHPLFILTFKQYAKWYYRENYTTAHDTYIMSFMNSKHAIINYDGECEVIAWYGMMISGSFATSHLNSLAHNVSNRYAFASSLLDKEGVTEYTYGDINFEEFEKNLDFVVFGDDIVGGHSFEELDLIDIAKKYKEMGMTITNADKSEFCGKGKTRVEELEFLKRNFVYDRRIGKYIGVLNLNAILEIPMWSEGKQTHAKLLDSVCDMLKELSLHGEETFTHYVDGIGDNSIRRVCESNSMATELFDYKKARAAVSKSDSYHSI